MVLLGWKEDSLLLIALKMMSIVFRNGLTFVKYNVLTSMS
jgi:hypothetical protein